jgi:hypothetical protein
MTEEFKDGETEFRILHCVLAKVEAKTSSAFRLMLRGADSLEQTKNRKWGGH